MRLLFIFLIALSVVLPVAAERFLGFSPGDRLTDVRRRYPNANFEEKRAAWLQPYQRLVQINGPGIDGVVAIKLEHEVDALASKLKDLAVKQVNRIPLTGTEAWAFETFPRMLERLRENPPLDPWEVKDIRWEPPKSIVLKSITGKYGPPEKDELDEQFRRVLRWEERGITAYISEVDVVQVLIFDFSIGDIICASRWKQGSECDPLDPAGTKREPAPKKLPQNAKSSGGARERVKK